jgi:hypothetical protein
LVIAVRQQTPEHIRGDWSHYTDTSEPVDSNGAKNMVSVQSEFRTKDLSITGSTRLPPALAGPTRVIKNSRNGEIMVKIVFRCEIIIEDSCSPFLFADVITICVSLFLYWEMVGNCLGKSSTTAYKCITEKSNYRNNTSTLYYFFAKKY